MKICGNRLKATQKVKGISKARHTNRFGAEQAKKLNYILDYSAEGIILTDREGIITDFNTSAERILQRKRTSVIGKSCRDVLPNTQLHIVMEQKAALLLGISRTMLWRKLKEHHIPGPV